MQSKPRKSGNRGLIFICLAVSAITASNTISSQMQQMPLRSLLQSESALAQTPNRQSPDAIVRWNSLTLDIIKAEKTSPPMAARNLGMVHAAAYDAANAVLKAQKVYKVEVQPPAGATAQVTYTPTNQPGFWQPIPPELKPASMPHWKNVKPFAMTKGSQFQIANMPSLTSEEYTTEFNKLKELGAKNSKIRTADQSAIAVFWLNNPGTLTPPGHWNQIAADVAVRRGNTFAQNLRLFAILNIALADASIIDGDQNIPSIGGGRLQEFNKQRKMAIPKQQPIQIGRLY